MTKPKAKFKKNDVIFLEDKSKAAIIDSKDYIQGRGWLYALKVVGKEGQWKRYYENRIVEECSKVKNDKAVKVLYGNSKKS